MNYQCKKSYSQYSYWESKIINNENLWVGNFSGEKITKDSVIIYSGMMNKDKNIFEHGWVVYPNIYTALGFIQNVFVPTATVTWHKDDADGLLIPIVDFYMILEKFIEDDLKDANLFKEINDIYNELDELWQENKDMINSKVNIISDKCNKLWDYEPDKKIFIKVFSNIDDIIPFIKEIIGWDELLEEETSMSLEKLNYITKKNVLSDELLNKVLIELLNNNMPVLF